MRAFRSLRDHRLQLWASVAVGVAVKAEPPIAPNRCNTYAQGDQMKHRYQITSVTQNPTNGSRSFVLDLV